MYDVRWHCRLIYYQLTNLRSIQFILNIDTAEGSRNELNLDRVPISTCGSILNSGGISMLLAHYIANGQRLTLADFGYCNRSRSGMF